MIESTLFQLGALILLATVFAGIMRALNQSLIIGYLLTGVLAGPLYLNLVGADDVLIGTFSELGIVFLLFIAGIHLNPHKMKGTGRTAIIAGLAQMGLTFLMGLGIALGFGFSQIESTYIGLALSFSSTIVVVKLLSDAGTLQSLSGKISMGILIVQDLLAVALLLLVSPGGGQSGTFLTNSFVFLLLFFPLLAYFSTKILPRAIQSIAKFPEFLLLVSIGWLILLTLLFSYLGFSKEIGALIAGISLSYSPHLYEIRFRMDVLRDFFILFFFIALGAMITFESIATYWVPILVFSGLVLIGKSTIIMGVLGGLNYTKRNGFLTGLTLAQISEFSFILVALGAKAGHLSQDLVSVMTAIGVITIFFSTALVTRSDRLYVKLSKRLGVFERAGWKRDQYVTQTHFRPEIVLFGCHRVGSRLLDSLLRMKKKILVVDFDPDIIQELRRRGVHALYGDANDPEFLSSLRLKHVKMAISTISNVHGNLPLVRRLRRISNKTIILVVAHTNEDALRLYSEGTSYVIMPYLLGGAFTSSLIEKNGLDITQFLKEKARHYEHLKRRGLLG